MDTITSFYLTHPLWIWGGLAATLLAVEVLTGSGWLLWVAASAGVTGLVVSLVGPDFTTTVLIFAALTLISTLAVRRYLPRAETASGQDINDYAGRLVGHRGSAVSAFVAGAGRVSVDGKEWAAQLDDGGVLDIGALVEITGIDGSQLKVRRC